MKRIYLDYAAATPLDKKVKKAMEPFWARKFANAGAIHAEGEEAKKAIENARSSAASVLGSKSGEVFFTSGATESNNLALFGIARHFKKGHIITSEIEHPSVLEPCMALEKEGFKITYLKVGADGIVDPEDVKKSLRPDTILASIVYANNKIGTIQPIREIGQIIKDYRLKTKNYGLFFHTDACQASNYLNLKIESLGVDLLTLNASKIYGPKGVGVLFKKTGVKISPQILGGGHEQGLRSGTPSTPLIVGLAEALVLTQKMKNYESKRLSELRDYFIQQVLKEIPGSKLNGHSKKRLPNNANFSFLQKEAESIIIKLDMMSVASSSGSACESQHQKDEKEERYSVRFSLGRHTNKKELNKVIEVLKKIVK
ncbi:MAG: cysteine desulfurase family protein [Patescibacteria group bacterium]